MSPAAPPSSAELILVTRADCGLCARMHAQLEALAGAHVLPSLQLLDVDSDAQLRRRYGLKVPVLLLDGEIVCFGRLDEDELLRMLARRR